jgi:hypothetical protein
MDWLIVQCDDGSAKERQPKSGHDSSLLHPMMLAAISASVCNLMTTLAWIWHADHEQMAQIGHATALKWGYQRSSPGCRNQTFVTV